MEIFNPLSLKQCCLCFVSRNYCLMKGRKENLIAFPKQLFYELCKYVSPYGLHLLEKQTSLPCYNVDYLFLTQWTFPSSYTLKARKRCRDLIVSSHSTVTNRQFFYDSVLNEVIEQLMYSQSLDECVKQAYHFFIQYPIDSGNISDERTSVESVEFMKTLSEHVTSLTVNLSVANKIMENKNIFLPVLVSIRDLNLNLQMKSSQHQYFGKLVEIITIARQGNLSSVRIKVRKESVLNCYEYFTQLAYALFHPVKPNLAVNKQNGLGVSDVTEIKFNTYNTDELDDSYDEILTSEDGAQVDSVETNDLYDCVFQDANKIYSGENVLRIVNDTNIVEFELSAYECKFYHIFLDYISHWRTLQKLFIHGYSYVHDLKMSSMFISLANYNNIQVLTLSDFWLETLDAHSTDSSQRSLIQLAKPSCKVHETKKSLRKLCLLNCNFDKNFIYSILCHKPSDYCRKTADQCIVDGLESLQMTLHRPSDELSLCLRQNRTLKQLIINISTYVSCDDFLLEEVSGMELHTFSLTCNLKPLGSPPPSNLQKLFRSGSLKHLVLSQICYDTYLFSGHGWENVLRDSKLTTLIWTKNGMENDGLIDFAGHLRYLKYLKVLDLSGNQFDIDGVSVFLHTLHNIRFYLEKLALGGCNVRSSDIEESGLNWIIKEYVNLFLGSYIQMDASDHIAQM